MQLIQTLRRLRRLVTARTLAEELGTSVRTVYRDIETFTSQGMNIHGEAGVGYVLHPGSLLPPMMFTEDEIEAVALGLGWVARRGDRPLQLAAQNARAKIHAVLTPVQQEMSEHAGLLAGPGKMLHHPPGLREALRRELRLSIQYVDAQGAKTERTVWPIALAFLRTFRLSWLGANAGRTFARSGPTASRSWRFWSATPSDADCCLPSGADGTTSLNHSSDC